MRKNKLINKKLLLSSLIGAIVLGTLGCSSKTETVRVAIGTQDTTINCATGGLLIRELNLLPKYKLSLHINVTLVQSLGT
jgi:NitT/TauT family transport system substrate-binding protein